MDSASQTRREIGDGEQRERTRTIVIPYVKGLGEDVRRICSRYNIRVAFRSCPTLRSNLTRVKDVLPTGLHSKVVYQIPCMCGKVYIGETVRRLDMRVNEHLEACKRGETSKSAVAEHAWDCQQPIMWNDTYWIGQEVNLN